MAVRKIIHIDEEKCDGCGECVPACAEGAIQIIDGKARLVSDVYCDGLGACLGNCPQAAITIEEREADDFDEKKTAEHLARLKKQNSSERPAPQPHPPAPHPLMGGCPGSKMRQFNRPAPAPTCVPGGATPSALCNWPVQLALVHPAAPYFRNADVLLAADCVPFAHADFHGGMLRGKPLIIGCPKLDNVEFYVDKLAELIKASDINSLTVAIMEVPCCHGLVQVAQMARERSGCDIPIEVIIVGVQGEVQRTVEVPA